MEILIDTSFLVATLVPKDQNHLAARKAQQNLKGTLIIPAPVLYELFYMIGSRINYREAIRVFRIIQSASFRIETLTELDMMRMAEIMEQYQDAEFDFADTSLMAISERLNITTIYTFDRRDFGMFRPKHTDFLNLLP